MRAKKGSILITLGLLLLAAALLLGAYNLYDNNRAQQSVRRTLTRLEEELDTGKEPEASDPPATALPLPDYVRYPEMEMPVKTVDGQDYIGILSIPALELELPVISQWSYPRLKTAPCRYSGSAYAGDLILAGHNYASHFGSLKLLQAGDRITFTDVDGNVFSYRVELVEILEPTAVEEMTGGGWSLTLFTCTVGGQSRVTVRCTQENN